MRETEQYLFFESDTASSTALRLNRPRTAYVSLICVNTRGGAGACVATAETRNPVSPWRFFWRMLTTSTDVQLQSAMRTASMGVGPCVCAASESKTIVLPF